MTYFLFLSLLAAVHQQPAENGPTGGVYDDPRGFSFTYPAGWQVRAHCKMLAVLQD